ncbi:MAG: AraC family transcriptional regulator [Prevotella sp.]|nr:AraC family transcriptional regulator [Prevotella sp.]
MKQRLHIIILLVVAILVGCTGGDTKNEEQVGDFNQIMHQADSLYNSMEFRTAYDLYLQLLDNKEAKADDEKMLNVLNSLCMASELAGHKAEQTKWMQQLLDLAKQTGNAYYESMGLMSLGKRIYYEGDRQQGVRYVNEAIDLMAKTDREDADHLTHSQMIILAGLYSDMNDLDNALRTDERNVRLTMEGTRWGNTPQLQLIDRRMALAKTAYCLAKMGNFQRADSVYTAWQSVQYEGDHTRDYFIADYLRERGRYPEAVKVNDDLIQKIRAHGDTLGEMMNCAKWGLAEVYQKMGNYKQAADLYVQVLEINDTLKARQAQNTAQELAAIYHDQEQKQTIQEQEMANTRKNYILVIVLAVLIGVIAYTVIIVRQKRIISQKNRSLVKQITEAMTYKELYNNEKARLAELTSQDKNDQQSDAPTDLNAMTDEQLFQHVTEVIERERLFLDPRFERQTVIDRFQLSKERVGNIFSQSEHAKLTNYIQQLRLEYAAQLLVEQPERSIVQIATDSGFSSHKYFTDRFRQYFTMTPTEFRKARE